MFTFVSKEITVDKDLMPNGQAGTLGKRCSPQTPINWNQFPRHIYCNHFFKKQCIKRYAGYSGNFVYWFSVIKCEGVKVEGPLIHPAWLVTRQQF